MQFLASRHLQPFFRSLQVGLQPCLNCAFPTKQAASPKKRDAQEGDARSRRLAEANSKDHANYQEYKTTELQSFGRHELGRGH